MAVMQSIVFASAVILVLLVNEGAAVIQCYECNSFNDNRCSQDNLPNDFMQNCTSVKDGRVSTTCRKIVQQIEFSVNGLEPNTRIIRSCAHDISETRSKCYKRAGFGGRQIVCGCEGNGCNGSMSLKSSMAVLPFAIVAAVAYLLRL